jgi:hypothetical protein
MSDHNVAREGIKIYYYNKKSFLIQSRTNREEHHMVEFATDEVGDITGCSCTCSGYQFRKECFHIRYICKLLGVETPQATNNQLEIAA